MISTLTKLKRLLPVASIFRKSSASIWLPSGGNGNKSGDNNDKNTKNEAEKKTEGSSAIAKIENLNLSYYCYNPKNLIGPKGSKEAEEVVPIIAMHGLFMSKDYFVPFAPVMAKHLKRPVYVVDLRNHGESAHRNFDGQATLAVMAQDVLNFMDEFSIPKAVLLGHGLGGRVAIQAAQLNSSRCDKVIAIDISQDGTQMFTRSFSKYLYYLDETGMTASNASLNYARLVMKQMLKSHVKNQFTLKFLVENIRTHEGNFKWRFNAKTLNTMLHHWAKVKKINYGSKVDLNVMSVVTKSNFITSEDYLDLRKNFDQCRVEYIGNRYVFSNSQKFLGKLETFVQSNKQ